MAEKVTEFPKEKYLSAIERERFAVLMRFNTIKDAATELGISPQTLYNWLCVLRKKYKQKHGWCNAIIAQRNHSHLLRSVLSEKKPLPPVNKDASEEEEEEDESKVDEFMKFAERQEQEKEETEAEEKYLMQ